MYCNKSKSFFPEKIDIIRSTNTLTSTELFLCDGDTYTLTADEIPGATYTWTRNDVLLAENDFDLEVFEEGFYKVFIDPNTGDCDSTLEGVAYVSYIENPVAYDYLLTQCDEDGIAGGFTRFNLNEATNYVTGNVTGLSVKFYTDMARANEITNTNSYNYNADNPQPIYVKVFDNNSSCYDTSLLTLNLINAPIEDFTATPLCDIVGSEDGINNFNLNNITTEIQTYYGYTYPVYYYKTFDDAILEQNELNTTYTNTTPYSQTIYARTESDNSCFSIKNVLLKVNKLPNIEPESTVYYCLNKYPETIVLNAGIINDSPNNYTYKWSTGDTTYQTNINTTGNYTVTVTNANGCSKDRTIIVEASNTATINDIKITDATKNNIVTVLVSGEGIYEYSLLDENNNIYAPFQSSHVFENVRPGFYSISVKDVKKDCGTTSPLKISVIGFPKVFTPNGDGYNDTWQVYGVSSMFQPNTKVQIFNRYGKLIKEINPLEDWNGLINGSELPVDDYWFTVKLQDGRIFKNHFSLKR